MAGITNLQRKRYFSLLRKLGYNKEQGNALVYEFSDNKTTSVSKGSTMTYLEMASLLHHLSEFTNDYQPTNSQQLNTMRKKMLFLGYQLGMDVVMGQNKATDLHNKKRSSINYFQVNQWCMSKRCTIPKALNDYTTEELAKVISQFEIVTKTELARWEL